MRERMLKILSIIKAQGFMVNDYLEEDEKTFELITDYSKHNHKTWISYDANNENSIVRMELSHIFGYLEINDGMTPDGVMELVNQLLSLFRNNVPSFADSSAYLGVRFVNGTFYTCLQASPIYSTKMSDEDIAESLYQQIFDLSMGLMFVHPPPIKQFGEE